MSAIFGERLAFPQEKGQEIRLIVHGDELYAHYETEDGYAVVYDREMGLYCYALLVDGAFVSSRIAAGEKPPQDLKKHLREADAVRRARAERSARRKGRTL
jgi:hypothetical protein